jgi:drug/metabolite transporter (DMT)-like permease
MMKQNTPPLATVVDTGLDEPKRGVPNMWTTIIIILIPTIAGVIGQLMLKIGMTQMGTLELSIAALPTIALKIMTSPMIIVGLAIYLGGVFFWLIGLNRLDLSFLYPFASLSYVLITIAAWAFLNEQVPGMRWLGLVVICIGVALVARS